MTLPRLEKNVPQESPGDRHEKDQARNQPGDGEPKHPVVFQMRKTQQEGEGCGHDGEGYLRTVFIDRQYARDEHADGGQLFDHAAEKPVDDHRIDDD